MHFKPKKRLGQNFLFDKNIQRKIISSCELKPSDIVLEIGAGRGELTYLIGERAGLIYAIEVDGRLSEILQGEFKENSNIKIINKDVLKFDINKHLGKFTSKIKIIGNIPYYIATPIIEYLFKYREKIETIFITVQKEFAKRVTAKPGSKEYGSLSIFVQYYARPQILFYIRRNSFFPVPGVDSCLLRLDILPRRSVKVAWERLFFKIVRSAFNKRRKTLRNSLKGIVSKRELEIFFKESGLDRNIRPEKLALGDFAKLTRKK